MSRLPPLPDIAFDAAGSLRALSHDDGYFGGADGLAEARLVFLTACGLPERWRDRPRFTVAELGFGTGLNLLAVWDLWRRTRPDGGVLHVVSVEAAPLPVDAAARVHAGFPALADLSARLLARWPVRAFGLQRIWFEEEGLCLTLAVGDAAGILPRMRFAADAWFLDGFAPSRNPDMWSPAVLAEVARLSAPGCRLGTYAAAGAVRRGLADAGFEVARRDGFAGKRHRTEAVLPGEAPERTPPGEVLVIGAGVAGAAMAAALTRRGVAAVIADDDPCGRRRASGNPAALVMPRLDRGDTPAAAFHRAAWLHALQAYAPLSGDGFDPCGVEERSRDDAHARRLADLAADPPLPQDLLTAGPEGQGLVHRAGGVAEPAVVLERWFAGARRLPPGRIARLVRDGSGWLACDAAGEVVWRGAAVVLACGADALPQIDDAAPAPVQRARGQVSMAPDADARGAVASGAYALGWRGRLLFGATFDALAEGAAPEPVNDADHARNLAGLVRIAPEPASRLAPDRLWGRVGVRAATPDRLPLAGAEAAPGLYRLGGLGARGFTVAPLCAEVVASLLCTEPSPVEARVAAALDPQRFCASRRPIAR
jgi:tRNA 5-methylaminomethyl-2-thiouridine biosynthesis bifunctional protein